MTDQTPFTPAADSITIHADEDFTAYFSAEHASLVVVDPDSGIAIQAYPKTTTEAEARATFAAKFVPGPTGPTTLRIL